MDDKNNGIIMGRNNIRVHIKENKCYNLKITKDNSTRLFNRIQFDSEGYLWSVVNHIELENIRGAYWLCCDHGHNELRTINCLLWNMDSLKDFFIISLTKNFPLIKGV